MRPILLIFCLIVLLPISAHAVERGSGWSAGISPFPSIAINYRTSIAKSTLWLTSLGARRSKSSNSDWVNHFYAPEYSTGTSLYVNTGIRRYGSNRLAHTYAQVLVGMGYFLDNNENLDSNVGIASGTHKVQSRSISVGLGGEYQIATSLFLESGFGVAVYQSRDRRNINANDNQSSESEHKNKWRLGSYVSSINIVYYFK